MSNKSGFRVALKDYAAKQLHIDMDKVNDFQRSEAMARGYVELILRHLNPGLFPEDEVDLRSCFVDGAGDGGVDIIIRENSHVLIVQCKYRGSAKEQDPTELDHFCSVLDRLHPKYGKGFKLAERVREVAADIDWRSDTFELHFITLGRVNGAMRARAKQGIKPSSWAKDLDTRTELFLYDEGELNDLLREGESTGSQVSETITLPFLEFGKGPRWLKYESNDSTAYIGCVSAGVLRNIYQNNKIKNRLFALNIRNYVGDTSTNKAMIETAQKEPTNFFFYNNGISAVATNIEVDERLGQLRCERFSVINGAQTVRSLAKAHNASQLSSDVAVLIRVSQVSLKSKGRDEAFLENITRFNNTQNAVKPSDFRSNDSVQRGLASKFDQLNRGGKRYWYKNKRTGERTNKSISIGMEDFAKTIYAFWFGPVDVLGGISFLFDTSEIGGYLKIYGVGGELPDTLSDRQFAELAGVWFVCEELRGYLDTEKARRLKTDDVMEATLVRHALERRWMFFYTCGEVLRVRYTEAGHKLIDDMARLAKPSWLDGETEPKHCLKACAEEACETLIKVYRHAQRHNPSFVHRNFFRNEETLAEINAELRSIRRVILTIPLLRADTNAR